MAGRKTAGSFCRMIFGVPVDPELHMPQPCGAIASGSGSVDSERLRSSHSA